MAGPRIAPHHGTNPSPIPTEFLDELVAACASHHHTSADALLSPSRRHPLPEARRLLAGALRQSGFSYQAIGDAIGRDHSTIVHLCQSMTDDDRSLASRLQQQAMHANLVDRIDAIDGLVDRIAEAVAQKILDCL